MLKAGLIFLVIYSVVTMLSTLFMTASPIKFGFISAFLMILRDFLLFIFCFYVIYKAIKKYF